MKYPVEIRRIGDWKLLRSPDYNYDFHLLTGTLLRWGNSKEIDPPMSSVGPEIADIEIVTGNCSGGCPWCYKSNRSLPGKVMSDITFWKIIRKMPPSLTQVALGITDLDANPDLVSIMEICRTLEIIPNLTISGLGNLSLIDDVAQLAGAIAVSVYPHNIEQAYDTICYLTEFYPDLQVNAHVLYHRDNVDFVKDVIDGCATNPRLSCLGALVLLGLKPRGRAENMYPLCTEKFKELVSYAMDNGVSLGMDSCSTPKFLSWMKDNPEASRGMEIFVEPCESSLFSIYINVDGIVYPCSFSEQVAEGIDIVGADDFLQDVWYSRSLSSFRECLLHCGRECPVYPEINR